MELIDKDELSKLVEEPLEAFLSRLDLKCPPTIKAIPISYLDEEIERCKKEGMEAEAYFLNEICRYWENKQ